MQRLRLLTLDPTQHPRGQAHLSSASGLVLVGRHGYVVADDEHHLARFDLHDPVASPLRLIGFADGTLPGDAKQRKKLKPDLETLIHVPGEQGLLVGWGSCSRPQRERAFVFALDGDGAMVGAANELSLTALCEPLRKHFGELNLEAGFVQGDRLHLFQRAHGGQPLNGHVIYPAGAMDAWLRGIAAMPPEPLAIEAIDLGRVDGVPLGITDAAALPGGGWTFSAVAEDTSDAYADGACVASIIGVMDDRNRLLHQERLPGGPKVEGIAFAGGERLWLVTDADDPLKASELLEMHWPAGATMSRCATP